MDGATSALVNLGFGGAMVGAVLWFLRHLLTVTLPQTSAQFLAELKEERAARAQEVREERAARQAQHADNRADHQQLLRAMMDVKDVLSARFDKATDELTAAVKDNRHMVKALDASVTTFIELTRRDLGQRRKHNPHPHPPAEEEGG